MGVFEMVAIIVVAGCIVEIYRVRMNSQSKAGKDDLGELQEQVDALKERVKTLEAIVTDKSYQLKSEIDQLGSRKT
ncbi:MAG: hypothetical protein JJU10_12540 [Idiomarina sp.]|nr:hypothetical protein [Idiomarina sp.]